MENDGHFSGEIVGIGTDLTDVVRIRALLEKYSGAFLKKAFGDVEASYCMSLANPAESLAARFAAKEAFSKALGTGIRGFSLREITVREDEAGKPYFHLEGRALSVSSGLSFHLSISHEREYAVAMVVAE